MFSKLGIISVCVFLCSCAALPSKPVQTDFDLYLDSMVVKERPFLQYTHSNHGKKLINQSPLAEDSKRCINEAYSGKTVTLGNRVITDPAVLRQIDNDQMYYNLERFLGFEKGSIFDLALQMTLSDVKKDVSRRDYESARRRIFSDEGVNTALKVLNDSSKNEKACLKNKGWLTETDLKKQQEEQQQKQKEQD